MAAQEVAQLVHGGFPARMRPLIYFDVCENSGRLKTRQLRPEGMTPEDYLAEVHALADSMEEPDVCYFVGGDEGAIKIGYAKDAASRLVGLQHGSPIRLGILAVASGGKTREWAYHYQFARFRLHGEWFERVPEIEAEIERLSNANR